MPPLTLTCVKTLVATSLKPPLTASVPPKPPRLPTEAAQRADRVAEAPDHRVQHGCGVGVECLGVAVRAAREGHAG